MADFTLDKLRQDLVKGLQQNVLSDQIERSLKLAYRGHDGQFRDHINPKAQKIPYIVHPIGVALIAHELMPLVSLQDSYDDIISACLTHDLIEDSNIDPKELERETSGRTTEIVLSLTKPQVQTDSTRQQRNEKFQRQIVGAGRTVMFIKLCDHCHNISRPKQTPVKLLEKAIRKGRTNILQFFGEEHLPETLKKRYLERLTSAEAEIIDLKKSSNLVKSVWTLGEAIKHCVQISEKKVLELHDIIETLQELTGASFVRSDTINHFLNDNIFYKTNFVKQNVKKQIEKMAINGIIEFSRLPRDIRNVVDLNVDTIYIFNLADSASTSEDNSIFIGLNNDDCQNWVNVETLQMIITFLSERLRAQDRNYIKSLAVYLASLRLEMDVEDVMKLQLSRKDLIQIRDLLDHSEFIQKKILHVLEHEFVRNGDDRDMPFIESRIKSPRSIVKKMILRKFTSYSDLDDLIGFRIVCSSTSEAERISHKIKSLILKQFSNEYMIENKSDTNNESGQSVSISGYRALHRYFSIKHDNLPGISIGCEIQVRTAFQDAWARVSHDLSYKLKNSSSETIKTELKKLAMLRDQADSIISEIGKK